jgi:hypothetical protein
MGTVAFLSGVELAAYFHLVPRSTMVELYLHSPICIHGIVLNYLSTGTTLLYVLFVIHNIFFINDHVYVTDKHYIGILECDRKDTNSK